MKKRFLAIFMTLCMLLTLLPTAAFASGNYEENMTWVDTYEELVAALANPSYRSIYIQPRQTNQYNEDIGPFLWPEEDVTLELGSSTYTSTELWLGNGTWTIPENVTVNAWKSLHLGAPTGMEVVINGTWNCMNNRAVIGNVSGGDGNGNTIHYGSVTVNGTLGIAEDVRMMPVSCDTFILNGVIKNAGELRLRNLTMGDGARIEEIKDPDLKNSTRSIDFSGTITCEGSAVIEGQLCPDDNTSTGSAARLIGDYQVDWLYQNSNTSLTIPKGSYVTVDKFTSNSTSWNSVLYLGGTMELSDCEGTYNSLDGNAVIEMDGGTLKIGAGKYLGSSNSTGRITGKGTVELYANSDEQGSYYSNKARIYSHRNSRDPWPEQLSSDVTIWRCWEDSCVHIWGNKTTIAPTCGTQGYTTAVCTACGVVMRDGILPATNQHHVTASRSNERYAWLNCSECGNSSNVYITAPEAAQYTGQPVEAASLEGSVDWLETVPTITYVNNVEEGVATATVNVMGIALTTTFEVVKCLHEGGTATCSQQAVCTKCSESYGETLPHKELTPATCKAQAVCSVCSQSYGEVSDEHHWGDELSAAATQHWATCEDCGERMTSQEEMAAWMSERGLLKQWHIYLETYYGNLPLVEAYGYFGHIFPVGSDSCLFCGGGPLRTESSEEGKTKVDLILDALDAGKVIQVVAALYENGQMVGTELKSVTVSEDGTVEESLALQYGKQYAPDTCKVFILDETGQKPLLDSLKGILN